MRSRTNGQKTNPDENMKARVKIGNALPVRNTLLAALAVIAVVLTSVWMRQSLRKTGADNRACAELLQKNATLRAQIRKAQSRQAGEEQAGIVMPANMSLAQMDEARRAEREERLRQIRVKSEAEAKSFNARIENDHEFAFKYYAAERAKIDRSHGLFLCSLRLSPEQRGAIAEAFFARAQRLDLMRRRLRAGELPYDDWDTRKEMSDQAQNELRDAIAGIAGERAVREFDQYERARPAWDYVNGVATELALGPAPLSLEQALGLASAIAGGSESFRMGGNVVAKGMDWQRVDAKAQAILSAGQLEFFAKARIEVEPGDNALASRQFAEFQQALEKLGK